MNANRLTIPEDATPEGAEAVNRINELMDLLRWFHDQGLALKVKSKKDGYTIELKAS